MGSNIRTALPSTFRSNAVLPFAPNGPSDRVHVWDWTNVSRMDPAGADDVAAFPTVGVETIQLEYVGLTRSDARTLESFFETTVGRKGGFWCPTFQHEFQAIETPPG